MNTSKPSHNMYLIRPEHIENNKECFAWQH